MILCRIAYTNKFTKTTGESPFLFEAQEAEMKARFANACFARAEHTLQSVELTDEEAEKELKKLKIFRSYENSPSLQQAYLRTLKR